MSGLHQVCSELRAREEAMTDGEEAVALELTRLLEDRALMEQQDMNTRLISLQISQLCQHQSVLLYLFLLWD